MCSFGALGEHLYVGFCGLVLYFDVKGLLVVVCVVGWAGVFIWIGMRVCA